MLLAIRAITTLGKPRFLAIGAIKTFPLEVVTDSVTCFMREVAGEYEPKPCDFRGKQVHPY